MKKISVLLLAVLVIAQFTLFAGAYTYNGNDLYTIDIPDEFTQVGEAQFIADDNSTFSVSTSPNEDEFCVENLSDEEIQKTAEEEAHNAKEAFSMIGKEGGMKVVSAKKIKHSSGKTAAVMVYETYMEKENETAKHLQKVYTFSCVDNIYSFVYTPHEDKDIDAFDSSFDSIKINETEIKSTFDKLQDFGLIFAFILLILLGIVRFLRTPEKRKKGKL